MDGTDDDCERLWWKRLQEYNPEQRLWKYLSTLAEGNAELDDNMPFEDELGEDDYYPSLPFAALFSCFKVTQFVSGLFESRNDLSTFKNHIRDFFLQSKEFSA
ncbi:Protein EXPORTIN 1A [Camellia lanceoleosa]|nr:Protein EXPORTIN 1A [Camellia lanceoleosa]